MTRFGIAGTSGHAGRVAAPVLKTSPHAMLLGAAGSTPERGRAYAREHGLPRGYASLEDMLRDPEIDAVWLCTPNHLHARQVAQCAAAGKHVLAEKPLATSAADADEAARAAARAGIILKVGCQHRFRPAHQHLRGLIQAGFVGRLGFFRIHRFWRYPYFPDMDPAGPPPWRRRMEESGGWVINDIGSHLLDLMLWMCGDGELAGAALASQQFKVGTEDSAAVLVRLAQGGIGVMETSCANASPGSRIEIHGSEGWIRADDTLSGAALVQAHDGRRVEFPPVEMLDTYRAEVADFVAALRGEPSIGADGADGARLVGIIESAVKGRP